MPITYKNCDIDSNALVHVCDPCLEAELGGIRSFALIKKGTVIDIPFVLASWTAAVEAGNIIIIPESNGTFDGGTPKMGSGYGNSKERKLGDDYILAVKDPNYAANIEFWEAAEKETWNAAFRTGSQLQYIYADVKVTAKAPVEADVDSEVVWNIEAKWFSTAKPTASPYAPLDTLFKCFELTA